MRRRLCIMLEKWNCKEGGSRRGFSENIKSSRQGKAGLRFSQASVVKASIDPRENKHRVHVPVGSLGASV